MSEEAFRRVQDEHDRMFPLRVGRSLYPRLSTVSSCRDIKVGIVASTPGTGGPSQAGKGGSGKDGSTTTGRGHGRGAGGRGSTPIGQIQSGIRTQARVFSVTQQEADASPDMITGMISVYDHDAYALVDPRATHSFISVPFTSPSL